MPTKLRLVFSIAIIFTCFSGFAQKNYWQVVGSNPSLQIQHRPGTHKAPLRISLDEKGFREALGGIASKAGRVISFPSVAGGVNSYTVEPFSAMHPDLQAKFPHIKSYKGTDSQGRQLWMSVSHKGVSATVVGDEGVAAFLEKSPDGTQYVLYEGHSAKADFECRTFSKAVGVMGLSAKFASDQVLRTYRIAVSASGEYTAYHGGTVSDALAAINATLTRVNAVFENDLSINLQLIANNNDIIFTDASADPYTGNFNSQVQQTLTDRIGEANYDVGHLFHGGENNGNAGFIGSVCVDNKKGSAFSSSTDPEGDLFDLDFVAHELGHQFGANHTWSFDSEGTFVQMEPASGSTIMGYAGIAEGNNVAAQGDDYFHYISVEQILDFVSNASCAQETPLSNSPPVVAPMMDYVIPQGTAFVLSGEATDPDAGDLLTYNWEQIDDGVVTTATFGPTNPSGANFRSLPPSISPVRYFPKLPRILSGELTQSFPGEGSDWETVSEVERQLNFAFTVRDNALGGGQISSEELQIQVTAGAGPFWVSSQASPVNYPAGSVQEVTWDVAATNQAPVNTQFVDIYLSVDGGNTFEVPLALQVPNDGSQMVQLPQSPTTTARIMVKGHENVFLAVNSSDFSIEASDFVLAFDTLEYTECQPNAIVANFDFIPNSGYTDQVDFSVQGLPVGMSAVFSQNSAQGALASVGLTLSTSGGVAPGFYDVTVSGTAGASVMEVPLDLHVVDTNLPAVQPIAPIMDATGVPLSPLLQWQSLEDAVSYDVEVAEDSGFTQAVESAEVIFNSFLVQGLEQNKTYYWRVRPRNGCAVGNFTVPMQFSTIQIDCREFAASDLPQTISATGTPIITSSLTLLEDLTIADLDVGVDLTHSYVSDLKVTLISPAGTRVVLLSSSCGDSQDVQAVFDDDAPAFACGTRPAILGTVSPLGSLNAFVGESTFGVWTLEVEDLAPEDGGELLGFTLSVCGEGTFRPDADEDGVYDDGDDLCLGTPKGAEVDVNGCAVYRFAPENFTLEVTTESCMNKNDGSIYLAAQELLDYQMEVQGPGGTQTVSFTQEYTLTNLASGTYTLCISGNDGPIAYREQCYTVVVDEPAPLAVQLALASDGRSVELDLQGGNWYHIKVNGRLFGTASSKYTLPLEAGTNTIQVYTDLPCQGMVQKEYFVPKAPVVYPNPVSDVAHIIMPAGSQRYLVRLYTSDGILLKQLYLEGGLDEGELDMSGYPAGLYVVHFNGGGRSYTQKIMKR